jgi:NADH:ubiquinone oxidoreductase subunit H
MLFDLIPFSFLVTIVTIGIVFGAVLTAVGYSTLLERKVSAWVQDRVGPKVVISQGFFWFGPTVG